MLNPGLAISVRERVEYIDPRWPLIWVSIHTSWGRKHIQWTELYTVIETKQNNLVPTQIVRFLWSARPFDHVWPTFQGWKELCTCVNVNHQHTNYASQAPCGFALDQARFLIISQDQVPPNGRPTPFRHRTGIRRPTCFSRRWIMKLLMSVLDLQICWWPVVISHPWKLLKGFTLDWFEKLDANVPVYSFWFCSSNETVSQ